MLWEKCDPVGNYIVVETLVGSVGTETYDTLNKDYKDVVWYGILPAEKKTDASVIRTQGCYKVQQ